MKNIPKNNRFTVRCNDHQTVLLNRYQRDLDDDESEASANTIKRLIEEIPSNKKVKEKLDRAEKKIERFKLNHTDSGERDARLNRYIDDDLEKHRTFTLEVVEENQRLKTENRNFFVNNEQLRASPYLHD